MRSPFRFLDPYTLADKETFFGRDKEIQQLYRQIQRTRLLILYGLSGTGKTSLIQCGLAGKFAGPDWLPIWVRRQTNINESVQAAIRRILPEAEDSSLSIQIRRLYQHFLRPVYLIFDQFEELFILGSPDEQTQFIVNLKTILEEQLPCTVLIVIREEYLGRLYPFEKAIHTLFDFRLRVEPMDYANVKKVLKSSFAKFNISYGNPPDDTRLDDVIQNVSLQRSGIELPYLQVFLDQLYREDFKRTYPGLELSADQQWPPIEITKDEVREFGTIDQVLNRYLDEQIERIQKELIKQQTDLPTNTVRAVLDGFVTDDETKRPVRYNRVNGLIEMETSERNFFPRISDSLLNTCLNELERAKLIRCEPETIELAHDSLAKIIHNRRPDQQREHNNMIRQIRMAMVTYPQTGDYLTRNQVAKFEDVLPKLLPEEVAFYNKSKEFRDAEEYQELAKEKKRNAKLRNRMIAAVVAGSIALFLFLLSIVFALIGDEAMEKQQRLIDAFYFYGDRYALALKKDEDNNKKYGFINKDGDTLISYKYDEAYIFDDYDGYARVKRDNVKYLLDTLKNEHLLALEIKALTDTITALDLHERELSSIHESVFSHPLLKIVLLYSNEIQQLPPQIGKLVNLQTLDLSFNKLTSVPDELGELSDLQSLVLNSNQLESLPERLGELSNLRELYLGDNKLKSLSAGLGQLTNLKRLYIYHNQLTRLPAELSKLINLEELSLGGNKLKNLSVELDQLTNLRILDLSANQLTGWPTKLSKLSNLRELYLGDNQLKSLPAELGQLTNLQILDLSGNQLTGWPDELSNLSNMTYLNLKGTKLSEETITKIKRQFPDCEVEY
ncbi:Leucine-rich repeat-containing protein 40 [Fibrisoma limi BUZ 3]|uniref:Leucine-rich repeat-containing protein 40 n=1 Tax=Fibrisoma limi BUZ 3 TaxID=1185876 RepID=I2GPE5_9BACT|nr:leucine-rich repeat domain-containing protein [Fibrisoma limi]CCH55773.1 Leucine-rich repeat-containing protein 40 [Fibrisoma limi BUZ 3]